MLYPSVQQLTNEKVNRYKLVIATAKCARYVTDQALEERESAEHGKDLERFAKDAKCEITADAANDKAVSVAIGKIRDGSFKILDD